MDDWLLDKEKEDVEKMYRCKVIADTCLEWVIIERIKTHDSKTICTKALVAGERDNRLIILTAKRKIKYQKEPTVTTEYETVASLPRKWFYVYDHENADNYYATIVDDGIVAFHEDLDFLLWFVRKNWRYYYKKYYKGAIVFLLGHYISEYIELDEFKKKFGIDLRNCKPFCFAERQ